MGIGGFSLLFTTTFNLSTYFWTARNRFMMSTIKSRWEGWIYEISLFEQPCVKNTLAIKMDLCYKLVNLNPSSFKEGIRYGVVTLAKESSAIVTFLYNPHLIAQVKTIPCYRWHPRGKHPYFSNSHGIFSIIKGCGKPCSWRSTAMNP